MHLGIPGDEPIPRYLAMGRFVVARGLFVSGPRPIDAPGAPPLPWAFGHGGCRVVLPAV